MINWPILKTEIRRNLKTVMIWSTIISSLVVLTMMLFTTVQEQAPQFELLLESFPPEFIEAFGATADSFTQIEGYFISQFMSLFVILNAILAAYLGSATLGKEIANGTFHLLAGRPISRTSLFLSKFLAIVFHLVVSNIIVLGISFISVELFTSEQASISFYVNAFWAAFQFQVFFGALSITLGIIFNDVLALIAGIGISLGSMILSGMGTLSGVPEFIKFLSPYYYLGFTNLSETGELLLPELYLLLAASMIFLVIGIIWFNRKDLNV